MQYIENVTLLNKGKEVNVIVDYFLLWRYPKDWYKIMKVKEKKNPGELMIGITVAHYIPIKDFQNLNKMDSSSFNMKVYKV